MWDTKPNDLVLRPMKSGLDPPWALERYLQPDISLGPAGGTESIAAQAVAVVPVVVPLVLMGACLGGSGAGFTRASIQGP